MHYVATVLQRFGYDADELSARPPQSERERVLERVRKGTLRFLVATDVAARGLDIPELSHVIQYELARGPEGYIHRAGRTGRAGATGTAISLVDLLEKMQLNDVVRRYGVDLQWRPMPTPEDVEAVVTERVTALLEAKLRDLNPLVRERMRRMLPLARNLGENDDELALVAMMLDEYYQATLHGTPEPPRIPVPTWARAATAGLRARAPDRTPDPAAGGAAAAAASARTG